MSRRFEGFADRIKAQPMAASDTTGDEENIPGNVPKATNTNTKENQMSDTNNEAVIAAATQAGHDAGFKAATELMTAVFASEHYEGREASANTFLAKASMFSASASDIIDVLAGVPKADKEAAVNTDELAAKAEGAARDEMKAELSKNKNSDVNADGGKVESSATDSAAVWDAAIARLSA